MKSASVGVIMNIAKVLMGFAYRTIFLYVLSAAYLGINGLFTNILQLLSLAELGVTTAITFRFYEPISRGDVVKVGKLMNFFRDVYRAIAAVIFFVGLALIPVMPHLINSSDTVPEDINLTIVYVLFLLNTVSSYLFTYKLTILSADQKNYQHAFVDAIITLLRYVLQAVILFATSNYTLTLGVGIATTLSFNYLFSLWVESKYKEVFAITENLESEDRKVIFDDTKALMYHKVGTVVLTGTDSAVLTKMVNLISAGIYSNYSLILVSLQAVMNQLLGNFVSSIGNARLNLDKEAYYDIYRKMNFFGLWITGLTTICLYVAIDDFIEVWLGKEYVFTGATTVVLCLQYFLQVSSNISMAFTNASGLFVKDRFRPMVEAVINLFVSIVFAHYWGITGVFLGTVVSILATTFWRIPYIIYKYDFCRSTKDYWNQYMLFLGITSAFGFGIALIKQQHLFPHTWMFLITEVILILLIYNLLLALAFRKREEFVFVIDTTAALLKRIVKRV